MLLTGAADDDVDVGDHDSEEPPAFTHAPPGLGWYGVAWYCLALTSYC